ncbi:hypothetical protein C6376_38125 [Streptomyces sp. P3]|nr:hypothetical protein C6376_38125 [Streptomyces sp. P3]
MRGQYGAHVYPRRVHFVERLPRTPSCKIQRFLLRGMSGEAVLAPPGARSHHWQPVRFWWSSASRSRSGRGHPAPPSPTATPTHVVRACDEASVDMAGARTGEGADP